METPQEKDTKETPEEKNTAEETKCEQEIDELETIKEKYEQVKDKFKLPTFEQLNDDFDISKIECNTETVLRDIRKVMITKFSSVLNFVELLLNPTTGSMFHMYLVKGVNGIEKDILKELFATLGEIEIESIEREINYNEQKEAEFIKNKFKQWQEMKLSLNKIVSSLKSNWKQAAIKKDRSYFG